MGTATSGVTGEGSVDVAIGENEIVALEEGHDLAFATIGEVGGVEERKRGGREEALLFAAAGGGFYEGRGVPLGEMEAIATDFEPTLEEIELGAFARAVGAFDDDEGAGVGAAGDGTAGLGQRGFGGLWARRRFDGSVRAVHSVGRRDECLRFSVVCHCYRTITTHGEWGGKTQRGKKTITQRHRGRRENAEKRKKNPHPETTRVRHPTLEEGEFDS